MGNVLASFSRQRKPLATALRPQINSFLRDIGYRRAPKAENDALLAAMRDRGDRAGVSYHEAHDHQCFVLGYSFAELVYPRHNFEVKLHIALYTWFVTAIDDKVADEAFRNDIAPFQCRLVRGEAQPTPFLRLLREVLGETFDHFDKTVAELIVMSTLAFISTTVLAESDEWRNLKRTKGGERFPWYIREKTGITDAYAYFNFPKAQYPDVSAFIEAIPEMGIFICHTNDILSFYKEELAGDTDTLIVARAFYSGRSHISELRCVIREAVAAVRRARLVLKDREPYASAWQDFVRGYVAMHTSNYRYRFWELGLDDEVSNGEVVHMAKHHPGSQDSDV